MLALNDLHHPPFRSAIRTPPLDARQHAITVHCISQAVASNEQIAFDARYREIRHKKSVTIAMR